MKIELKKISLHDEENCLGYDRITILDRHITSIRKARREEDWKIYESDHYVYAFLAICDGNLLTIHEDDWDAVDLYYEVVSYEG
jgi:hypothetical protein